MRIPPETQSERLSAAVQEVRHQTSPRTLAKTDGKLAITLDEHEVWHRWNTMGQVHGVVGLESAMWLQEKIGPFHSNGKNGGWPPDVDTATKVVATAMIGTIAKELHRRRLIATPAEVLLR